MLKNLLSVLTTRQIQNICNTCAHILFKRKYWYPASSNHPELQIPQGFSIVIAKIEKWEWKVYDEAGNELSHGVSPTPQLATLDGHLWIELLEIDKCNTPQTNTKSQ